MALHKTKIAIFLISILLILTACSKKSTSSVGDKSPYQLTLAAVVATIQIKPTLPSTNEPIEVTQSPQNPTETKKVGEPTATSTIHVTPTEDKRLDPKHWSSWPIIPLLSPGAMKIYQHGQELGNNPQLLSTIGDCQSAPDVFLGIYDTNRYWLGNYQYLQDTIDYYKGAFSHRSISVRDGLSAPSALSPQWADPNQCNPDETPVACELRISKPSIVFINLGTNWKAGASADRYEGYLRKIVDQVIAAGALPILSTKADNVEGDHSLNLATARVAYDYDIPLWNFWLAAQSLPNGGLDPKRGNIYLSFPDGWDRRNFTALQTLDAIRRSLMNLPPPPEK